MVPLDIELAGAGQCKPTLQMPGHSAVQPRALGMASGSCHADHSASLARFMGERIAAEPPGAALINDAVLNQAPLRFGVDAPVEEGARLALILANTRGLDHL